MGQKYFAPTENRTQSRPVRSPVTVLTEPHETARTDTLMSELPDSLVWWICQCVQCRVVCTGGCEQWWANCSSGADCTVGRSAQWDGLHSEQHEEARNEMARACGTYGGEQKCTQVFGREIGRKETTWKT